MRTLIVLGCLVAAVACYAHEQAPWVSYSNAEAGFKLSFPQKPVSRSMTIPIKGYKIPSTLVMWGTDTYGMVAMSFLYPSTVKVKGNEDTILQAGVDSVSKKPDVKLLQTDNVKVAGCPGRHLVLSRGHNVYLEAYVFTRGQHVFVVASAAMNMSGLSNPEFRKFFNSFQFAK